MARKQENKAKVSFIRESLYTRNLIFALDVRESLSPRKFIPAKLSTNKVIVAPPLMKKCLKKRQKIKENLEY